MASALDRRLRFAIVVLGITFLTAICNFILVPAISGRGVLLNGFGSARVLTIASAAILGLLFTRYSGAKQKLPSLLWSAALIGMLGIATSLASRFLHGASGIPAYLAPMYAKHFVSTALSSALILFLDSQYLRNKN